MRAQLETGIDAVVKIVSRQHPGDKFPAEREIKLLRMFRDVGAQHICCIKDVVMTPTCSAMVLECMELGTLRDLLDTSPPDHTVRDPTVAGGVTRMRLRPLLHMCADVLAGLNVMHTHGVCHGDINPSNIGANVMKTLGRVGYKILDLGIAVTQVAKTSTAPGFPPPPPDAGAPQTTPPAASPCSNMMTELKNLRGTRLFMSPEQLDPQKMVSIILHW